MATAAGWSVQRSIYQALAGSSDLVALLGGARIYDNPPQAAAFPYISISESTLRDWSTGMEDGAEHLITLHVWSRAGGKQEVHNIVEAIKDVLHDQPLALVDHRLVNLRHQYSEVRLDLDGHTFHGIARYRAVTEPLTEAA